LWLELGMTRWLPLAGTRHDRRGVFWLDLGMTERLLVTRTRHDKRAAFWLELGMTGGVSFGLN
jgi:hypothetical protein